MTRRPAAALAGAGGIALVRHAAVAKAVRVSADHPNATRADQVAALLAAAPPRVVPAELLRPALRRSAPLSLAVFGSGFMLVGAFFAYMSFPWNFYRESRLAAADTATANGRVISTARTNMSVNKTRVISYEFEFQTSSGAGVRSVCYTTGQAWRPGSAVTVRYRPEEPALCCIAGARLTEMGWAGAFVLLFPVVGAGLVAWIVFARRRMAELLKNGFLAEALVTGVEATAMRVNNRYVHKITLQRTDLPDGGAFVVKQTAPEVIAFANERMNAKQPVFVLYDPAKPKRATLPETL